MFICPICNNNKVAGILKLDCGNLDNSTLYKIADIVSCTKCSHIFNRLSSNEIDGLFKYYNEEYSPINVSIENQLMVTNSEKRYDNLYKFVKPYVKYNSKILDVGCGTGGFLNYLLQKGIKKLYGIDISKKYIGFAKKNNAVNIKIGSAEAIPFKSKTFDFVVMDQVVEHLFNPKKAFREAKRVLNDTGFLCISIPDASNYVKRNFFNFYWFLLREHIQHFDIEHLKLLALSQGFKIKTIRRYFVPMTSDRMILPALTVIFSPVKTTSGVTEIFPQTKKLKKEIRQYIKNGSKNLNKTRIKIRHLISLKKDVYVWGIGREFLFLHESAGLKRCNLAGLIDINPYKQKFCSVNGTKIKGSEILKNANPDSILVITASGHVNQIKNEVRKLHYKGQIILS